MCLLTEWVDNVVKIFSPKLWHMDLVATLIKKACVRVHAGHMIKSVTQYNGQVDLWKKL